MSDKPNPIVGIVAGINGAGKTTASRAVLRDVLQLPVFTNADAIARGLNAFDPEAEAARAGRVMLDWMHDLASQRRSFGFETTLAARTYANWLTGLKANGYAVSLFYYWLENPETAIARVATRVQSGGHHIPEETIRRRYSRSVRNFLELYRPLADNWRVYDNSHGASRLLAFGCGEAGHVLDSDKWSQFERSTRNG